MPKHARGAWKSYSPAGISRLCVPGGSRAQATTRDHIIPALARFEAHRSLLFGIAYRMLGVVADAEDVLQEARMRWLSVDLETVQTDRAYLVTVVSRLCLDQLGSAQARRETYIGPWLPEPIYTPSGADADSLSMAFLLLLEKLRPKERAAFLLSDVFDYTHREVADVLETTEENARQMAARARKALRSERAQPVSKETHERLLYAFAMASGSGDLAGLEQMLATDAAFYSDSGGKTKAARNVVSGARDVSRLVAGLAKKQPADLTFSIELVNGQPAIQLLVGGVVYSILALELEGEKIKSVFVVTNPDKLSHLRAIVA